MADALLWLLLVRVAGAAAFAIFRPSLSALPDRGYGVAAVIALLLMTWSTWFASALGGLPFNRGTVTVAFLLLVLLSVRQARRQWPALRDFCRQRLRMILTVETVFVLTFVFWALATSETGAIVHTEKPMDFGILHAVVSSGSSPPPDLWLAGESVAYYYGGHQAAGFLTLLSGVAADRGYALALATVAALTLTGAFSLLYNLVRLGGYGHHVKRWALAGSVFLITAGNSIGLVEFIHVRGWGGEAFWSWIGIKDLGAGSAAGGFFPEGFWWWWRGTRLIDTLDAGGNSLDYTITEFPFFSLMLGDLHAHVSALPFLMLALTLALLVLSDRFPPGWVWLRRNPATAGLLALATGMLAFVNTWDFPLCMFIVVVAAGLRWLPASLKTTPSTSAGSTSIRSLTRIARPTLVLAAALAAATLLLYHPFWTTFDSQAGGIAPTLGPATRPLHFLLFMGVPALAAGAWVVSLLLRNLRDQPGERRRAAWIIGLSASPFLVWLVMGTLQFSLAESNPTLAESVVLNRLRLALPLLMLGGAAFHLAVSRLDPRGYDPGMVFALVLAGAGFWLLAGAELFHVSDQFNNRMNTVFKTYYQSWALLSIAGTYGLYHMVAEYRKTPAHRVLQRDRWVLRAGTAALAAALLVAAYYPAGAMLERTGWLQSGHQGGRTLSTMSRVLADYPDEHAAVAWLSAQPPGHLSEAAGNSYSDHGRVSIASGRATVINWPGHERQWRGDDPRIADHEWALNQIYENPEDDEVSRLLNRYDVRYLVVGPRERQRYGEGVDQLMAERAQRTLLTVGFRSGGYTVYEYAPESD